MLSVLNFPCTYLFSRLCAGIPGKQLFDQAGDPVAEYCCVKCIPVSLLLWDQYLSGNLHMNPPINDGQNVIHMPVRCIKLDPTIPIFGRLQSRNFIPTLAKVYELI